MQSNVLTPWLLFSHSPMAKEISITTLLERYEGPADFIKVYLKRKTSPACCWGKPIEQLIFEACQWVKTPGHHIVTFKDVEYPPLLKEISMPPPLLYVIGQPSILSLPQLSVVGSRYPSHLGGAHVKQFVRALVGAGLVITSGLALGIDACSHQAALECGGQTIAVLGNGLASVYPRSHCQLAARIVQQGCLISELPLHAPPKKQHFPQRNRIISGLSLGTLVVEAKSKSGSLITAYHAVNQGREVFAIPGCIRNALSRGCHQLIREGALLTEAPNDIFAALNFANLSSAKIEGRASIEPQQQQQTVVAGSLLNLKLDPQEYQLLGCVDYQGTPVEEVIKRSGLDSASVARLLLKLELRGLLVSAPPGYQRVK